MPRIKSKQHKGSSSFTKPRRRVTDKKSPVDVLIAEFELLFDSCCGSEAASSNNESISAGFVPYSESEVEPEAEPQDDLGADTDLASDSECGEVDDDIMGEVVRKLIASLSQEGRSRLEHNWRSLDQLQQGRGRKYERGSGCSGSAMDSHGQDKVVSHYNDLFNCSVGISTRLETDNDKQKQRWLKQFSKFFL